MKTTVKYVVLKNLDYQLGTPLFQEELNADSQYFDQIHNGEGKKTIFGLLKVLKQLKNRE